MKFGLIGTGKQGQRYLLEKNGGSNISVSGSRMIPLEEVDAVIIATHPAAHAHLALQCIAAGKPVLVEKPLALTLEDCERIISVAERANVPLEVAHTHLWSSLWVPKIPSAKVRAAAYYQTHERDYSPWLDWAPHPLSLVAQVKPKATPAELREAVHVGKDKEYRGVRCSGEGWNYDGSQIDEGAPTPMHRMLASFALRFKSSYAHWRERNEFNRRIYRALFLE